MHRHSLLFLGLLLGGLLLAALSLGCKGRSSEAGIDDASSHQAPDDPVTGAADDPALEESAEKAILAVGGLVRRDDSHPAKPVIFVSLVFTKGDVDDNARYCTPMTQVREIIFNYTKLSDAGLVHVRGLRHTKNLALHGTKVSDAGLENIADMIHLTNLDLSGTGVSGTGFVYLARMKRLEELELQKAPIEDASLVHLKALSNLESLDLYKTQVAGPGLVHLHGLKKLRRLQVGGTVAVSPEAIAALRSAIPQLRVVGAD